MVTSSGTSPAYASRSADSALASAAPPAAAAPRTPHSTALHAALHTAPRTPHSTSRLPGSGLGGEGSPYSPHPTSLHGPSPLSASYSVPMAETPSRHFVSCAAPPRPFPLASEEDDLMRPATEVHAPPTGSLADLADGDESDAPPGTDEGVLAQTSRLTAEFLDLERLAASTAAASPAPAATSGCHPTSAAAAKAAARHPRTSRGDRTSRGGSTLALLNAGSPSCRTPRGSSAELSAIGGAAISARSAPPSRLPTPTRLQPPCRAGTVSSQSNPATIPASVPNVPFPSAAAAAAAGAHHGAPRGECYDGFHAGYAYDLGDKGHSAGQGAVVGAHSGASYGDAYQDAYQDAGTRAGPAPTTAPYVPGTAHAAAMKSPGRKAPRTAPKTPGRGAKSGELPHTPSAVSPHGGGAQGTWGEGTIGGEWGECSSRDVGAGEMRSTAGGFSAVDSPKYGAKRVRAAAGAKPSARDETADKGERPHICWASCDAEPRAMPGAMPAGVQLGAPSPLPRAPPAPPSAAVPPPKAPPAKAPPRPLPEWDSTPANHVPPYKPAPSCRSRYAHVGESDYVSEASVRSASSRLSVTADGKAATARLSVSAERIGDGPAPPPPSVRLKVPRSVAKREMGADTPPLSSPMPAASVAAPSSRVPRPTPPTVAAAAPPPQPNTPASTSHGAVAGAVPGSRPVQKASRIGPKPRRDTFTPVVP
jgi:hypothetical protein